MRRHSEGVQELQSLTDPAEPWPSHWTVRGVVELLEPLVSPERRSRIERVIEARLDSVTVVLDAPHDPHNGAAVLRSCEAFGIARIHVVASAEPFLVAHSVARGTEYWVQTQVHPRPEHAVAALTSAGFELVVTRPDGELLPQDLAHVPRLALLLGNEHMGICGVLAGAAQRSVRIPMRGFVESLNMSVAAAILLSAATGSRPGDLLAEQKLGLYARGLYRTVSRAREILEGSRAR